MSLYDDELNFQSLEDSEDNSFVDEDEYGFADNDNEIAVEASTAIIGFSGMTEKDIQSYVCQQLRDHYKPFDSDSPFMKMQDIQASTLYAEIFGKEIKYDESAEIWLVYQVSNGTWVRNDSAAIKYATCLGKAMDQYYEENIKPNLAEEKIIKSYEKKVLRLMGTKNIESCLKLVKTIDGMHIDESILDADSNIINCVNGELHLDDLKLYPHRPESFCTKNTNHSYNPNAVSTLWEDTLSKTFSTDDGPDPATQEYFHQAVGYSIDGSWTLKKFFILYGMTTNNGKSTIMNALTNALGGYATNISAKAFCAKTRGNNGPTESLANLSGLRFVAAAEAEQDWPLDCELLKNLTGGDAVQVRKLYGHEFSLVETFKIWIHTNWIPNVTDPTVFDSHRAIVIPVEHKFVPGSDEWNPLLPDQLMERENAEGILAWIISGLKNFREGGCKLVETKRIADAIEEQKLASNKTQQFVEECLVQMDRCNVSVTNAYAAYRKWCQKCGYTPYNRNRFRSALKNLGIEISKAKDNQPYIGNGNTTSCLRGWAIKDSFESEFGD